MAKPLLRTLLGQRTEPVPFWFMRQAGRYLPEYRRIRQRARSFLELVYSPDSAAEITLQPIRRYGMSAAILFSDILVIPDALGQPVRFEEGRGPILEPLQHGAALESLIVGRVLDHLSPVFETIRLVKRELAPDVALIGFAGAPWTVATYMIEGGSSPDHAITKRWAREDPASFSALMEVLVAATTEYLVAQVEAGAEALQLFDSWAGSVPEDERDAWVFTPTRHIVENLRERAAGVPLIGFPRGIGKAVVDFTSATRVDAVSLGNEIGADWAAANIPREVSIQGNLDPKLLKADEDEMIAGADGILRAFSDRAHVFNLGHGITPDIDPERVKGLCDFLRGWEFSGE